MKTANVQKWSTALHVTLLLDVVEDALGRKMAPKEGQTLLQSLDVSGVAGNSSAFGQWLVRKEGDKMSDRMSALAARYADPAPVPPADPPKA